MSFNDYISNAWREHATNPQKVADEIKSNFNLMKTEDDVMAISRLIVHVCGDHLGNWDLGISLLKKLKNNATIKDKNEMNRLVAILNLGNSPQSSIDNFSSSDQVHIYAKTAQALASLGGIKNANNFLSKALELANSKLESNDPAFKILAMAGNNIASSLEEKTGRNNLDDEFMIFAAKVARAFWEKAGTWKEIERAEYRLCKNYLCLNNIENAKKHATLCLEIVNDNKSEPLEIFFAYELQAIISKAENNNLSYARYIELLNSSFDNLTLEDQEWCKETLNKFNI